MSITKLSGSHPQFHSLSEVINTWLADVQEIPEGSSRRVTPMETLAIAPLRRVYRRLQAQLLRRAQRIGPPPKNPDLNMTLTLPELLGLYYCLPWGTDVSDLTPLLGEVHRLLLRFDQYVTIE